MTGLSHDDIDEIIRLIDNSNFDEFTLEIGDTRIELRRNGARPATSAPSAPAPAAATHHSSAPIKPAAQPHASTPASPPAARRGDGVDVPAPQLGIFYHAPRPGEPPFVSVGDAVEPDTVIGIIEVMKLMNTVAAGVTGTVTEVVVANGSSVKQGDTLIRVRPG